MAEFIPDREARKGGTQFTENTAVICECCEGEMKEYEPGGLRADSRCCTFLHLKNKQTKNNTAPQEAANSHLDLTTDYHRWHSACSISRQGEYLSLGGMQHLSKDIVS